MMRALGDFLRRFASCCGEQAADAHQHQPPSNPYSLINEKTANKLSYNDRLNREGINLATTTDQQ